MSRFSLKEKKYSNEMGTNTHSVGVGEIPTGIYQRAKTSSLMISEETKRKSELGTHTMSPAISNLNIIEPPQRENNN